ncbi:MAG: DUF721 domain-containing protein [Nitrospirota bacterium]
MSNRLLPLSSVFSELLKDLHLEKELTLYKMTEQWEEIVGSQIKTHARPEKIWNDTLYLTVDSAPWMNQLHFLKKEIAEKINRHLKKSHIKEIVFKIGSLRGADPKTKKTAAIITNSIALAVTPPLYLPGEVSELTTKINALSDTSIRKIIKEALAGYANPAP